MSLINALLRMWSERPARCTSDRRCCSCHRLVVPGQEQILVIVLDDVIRTDLILDLCNHCTIRTGIKTDWRFSTPVKLLFPPKQTTEGGKS